MSDWLSLRRPFSVLFPKKLSVASRGSGRRSLLLFHGSAAALCLALVSCGGSQKKPVEDASQSKGEAAESKAAQRRAKLEPAPAPTGVVVRFRAKNAASFLDGLFEAASIPFSWRRALEQDRDAARLMRVIDIEGTTDALIAMNPGNPQKPYGIYSVGVKGVDPVVALLEKEKISALEGPGGVFYFEVPDQSCAVGPAIAGSFARVACSERRASLDKLLPYALRGMPQEQLSDSDVHAEFRMAPVRKVYGKELKTMLRLVPALARSQHVRQVHMDRALSDAAAALSSEAAALIDELDSVSFQVDQKKGDFQVRLRLKMEGNRSQTVQI